MNKEISKAEAQDKLSEILVGCSINKVSYFITGWDLRLIGESGPEYNLYAAEIRIPEIDKWWITIGELPINLKNSNEADDTIAAMNIFTVTNKWPVSSIAINHQSNLELKFDNGCSLYMPAVVDCVDWTWEVNTETGTNIVSCESGLLSGNESYFK
jgi:hypothetical protein